MRNVLLPLLAVCFPLSGFAQVVCPAGLVSPDQLHCCWPGQSWSAEAKGCSGEPECPAGFTSRDGSCSSRAPEAAVLTIPQPLAAPVTVRFRAAEEGDQYVVSTNSASCTTPCSLALSTGKNRVWVRGSARFRSNLNLDVSAPTEVVIKRRKDALAALGVSSIAIGGATAVLGHLVALGLFATEGLYGERMPWADATNIERRNGGLAAVQIGSALAVGGGCLGLGLAGRNRLEIVRPERAEGPKLVGLGLAPSTDGRGLSASAAFSF